MIRNILLLVFFTGCSSFLHGQATRRIIHKDQLIKFLDPPGDTLYVLNFWATFCVPCVEELPAFRDCEKTFQDKKIRFIYISIDFKSRYQSAFLPFVEKHLVNSEVYLLDEPDYNSWINLVEPGWSGEIPMTAYRRKMPAVKEYYAGQQDSILLTNTLNNYLKP
jgi:thiol-disulfide isomerase/thioredoxin